MIVYRAEDFKGRGLYTEGTAGSIGMNNSFSGRHPAPRDDSKLVAELIRVFGASTILREMRFGFGSLEQFKFWVHEDRWRIALHNHGFYVGEYEVPQNQCAVGDTQAVFVKESATLLRMISLMEV